MITSICNARVFDGEGVLAALREFRPDLGHPLAVAQLSRVHEPGDHQAGQGLGGGEDRRQGRVVELPGLGAVGVAGPEVEHDHGPGGNGGEEGAGLGVLPEVALVDHEPALQHPRGLRVARAHRLEDRAAGPGDPFRVVRGRHVLVEGVRVVEAARAVEGRLLGGARRVGIHHGAELRPFGFVDGAAVVLSELPGADYG